MIHEEQEQTRSAGVGNSRTLGLLIIATALLLNKWSLERMLLADRHLASPLAIGFVFVTQFGAAGLGVALLWRAPQIPPLLRATLIGLLAIGIGTGSFYTLRALGILDPQRDLRRLMREVNEEEELILGLTDSLSRLQLSVANLSLPDHYTRDMFAGEVLCRDLGAKQSQVQGRIQRTAWDCEAPEQARANTELDLLHEFFESTNRVERSAFKVLSGRFDTPNRFLTQVRCTVLAVLSSGELAELRLTLDLWWEAGDSRKEPKPGSLVDDASRWRISAWLPTQATQLVTGETLFLESLDSALSGESLLTTRRSVHHELSKAIMRGEQEKPKGYQRIASEQNPSVSVVDINRDGFDDLFLTSRLDGPCQLLENSREGTFRETTAEWGLPATGEYTCSAFADFDNDGDSDLVVGRALSPAEYWVNQGTRFERQHVKAMPSQVVSLSVVDLEGDGLLDVYMCTYGFPEVLPPHSTTDRIGPANVVFQNRGGGRFERLAGESPLLSERWTFQSTWADFDEDGDQDVYLANDWAENQLLRNDGHGRFDDVTEATGTGDLGFGMGASWGDYDNDGDPDLYVSNMSSVAGRRIAKHFREFDLPTVVAAEGNTLLANPAAQSSSTFVKASGSTPPSLQVGHAGWSWGGQFADVDNDGFQDICVSSGFYTHPSDTPAPDI